MLISYIRFRFHKFVNVIAVNQVSSKCSDAVLTKMNTVSMHAVKFWGRASDIVPIINFCVRRGHWLVRAPIFLPPEKEPPPYMEQKAGRFPEFMWTLWRAEESFVH